MSATSTESVIDPKPITRKPTRDSSWLSSLQKISYTRLEAAAVTGISLHAIKEAVSNGTLPAKRKGREWIILADDLRNWVAS